ncbi:MAG: four helix bundle protein [Bacteroidetes bacterium]|nr:four helix bundle protein [Fibrella sp.]
MGVKRFEDLLIWQKGQDLSVFVYDLYRSNRDWGFKDQICRASVSVSNNIAEGFDRGSNADFIRFLNYSRTSANEVKSMSYLAYRLGYIDLALRDELIKMTEELSRMTLALMRSLNN